jgi:hypothetical protein
MDIVGYGLRRNADLYTGALVPVSEVPGASTANATSTTPHMKPFLAMVHLLFHGLASDWSYA